jgi:hypothetical protein
LRIREQALVSNDARVPLISWLDIVRVSGGAHEHRASRRCLCARSHVTNAQWRAALAL